jgi:hypothetical protein
MTGFLDLYDLHALIEPSEFYGPHPSKSPGKDNELIKKGL